jgi:hypothetical protein
MTSSISNAHQNSMDYLKTTYEQNSETNTFNEENEKTNTVDSDEGLSLTISEDDINSSSNSNSDIDSKGKSTEKEDTIVNSISVKASVCVSVFVIFKTCASYTNTNTFKNTLTETTNQQETNEKEVFIEAYSSETTIHRYRVIRMWEQDSALFLNNPGLLPLAPLTRTNSPQSLLSQVSENVAKISDRETQQDIAAYTEILAGLRFEKNLIRQLLSEEIMQESVIYQDILQKGEQRTIIRLLNRRFGEIDSSLLNSIRMLTIEKLDDLADSLLDFSEISDLVTWLNRHEN